MSDFESKVRETLRTGSEGAPPAVGLAEEARRRWRKRRRTTAVVAATAVVLAAVPLGIALLGEGGSTAKEDDNVVADNLPEIPDGWRWESWRTVQIAVPGNWENGAASQWCVSSDSNAGFVDRGEGFSTQVACLPGLSSSVTFREGIAKHPLTDIQGVGRRLTFDGNTVDVVARDQETLDTIVATAHEFEDADSRGCAPTIQDLAGSPSAAASGTLTVCRYQRGLLTTDPTVLSESRDLSEDESDAWVVALEAAPAVSEFSNGCDAVGGEALLISSSDGVVAYIEGNACGDGFVQTADGEKALSIELLTPLGSQLSFPG